jgi:hypothetical protein
MKVMPLAEDHELHLLPGPHSLQARYSMMHTEDDENYELLYSNPVNLKVNAQGGRAYRLVYEDPKPHRGMDSPLKVPMRISEVEEPEPAVTPGPRKDRPLPPEPPDMKKVVGGTPDPTASGGGSRATPGERPAADLETLREMWKGLDPEQREQFMKWILSPPE